jgi:hypothetical protein
VPVEIWFQDEARVGQQGTLTRIWARRGTRPRIKRDRRFTWAYLFGAICPARGTGAALALPFADTEAMQLHLDEISRRVAKGAHAVLLLDRADWHTTVKLEVPKNITPIFPIKRLAPAKKFHTGAFVKDGFISFFFPSPCPFLLLRAPFHALFLYFSPLYVSLMDNMGYCNL